VNDPHGNRRQAEGAGAWMALVVGYTATNTTHGYTGHEHVDLANIVHMNGRLYDPALGRMLSPDPIVQEMYNAQDLNRYTYVLNNPLSFTDPAGLSFIKKYWRTIVATAITVFVPMLAPAMNSILVGFISGTISSGSIEGGVFGAFSAGLFHSIGDAFGAMADANRAGMEFGPVNMMRNGLTTGQFAGKIAAHAAAGGIMSTLQGGKFGHGFMSAGVTQGLAPAIDSVGGQGFSPTRVTLAAFVGGSTSALTGGKFANGALTAAFSRAFNDESEFDKWTEALYHNKHSERSPRPPEQVLTPLMTCHENVGIDVPFGNTVPRPPASSGRPYQRARVQPYWSTLVVGMIVPPPGSSVLDAVVGFTRRRCARVSASSHRPA
jgi:RHS repeat-associated protein